MSATLYWSRTGKEAGRNADTKRCCAREATLKRKIPFGRKSAIAEKICEKVGCGRRGFPHNASQKICITRGKSRDCVFAAASDFLLHRARSPRTPLISSWNRRILFFTGQRALFRDGTSFSLRFPSYFLSGARPAGVLRRPGHRKKSPTHRAFARFPMANRADN